VGPNVEVSVEDNGIGIQSGAEERIFQIFQRLHTVAEYAGTGIGLAVCKKIVEAQGGKMWVTPNHPNGSVFHFTLTAPPKARRRNERYGCTT
jgi:signal transduction histidine kinase